MDEEKLEVMSGAALRWQAAEVQLRGVLTHATRGHLTCADRQRLAEATAQLVAVARLEEGLPVSVEVVRSVSSLEDALAMLEEESAEAEEH